MNYFHQIQLSPADFTRLESDLTCYNDDDARRAEEFLCDIESAIQIEHAGDQTVVRVEGINSDEILSLLQDRLESSNKGVNKITFKNSTRLTFPETCWLQLDSVSYGVIPNYVSKAEECESYYSSYSFFGPLCA